VDWLAYAHPLLMPVVLVLGLLTLREGLRIQRGRIAGREVDASLHRALGKAFVLLAALGWISGSASMAFLRRDPPLESLHAVLTSVSVAALIAAASLGVLLQRGAGSGARTAHLVCGASGLLAALGAAVAGFSILP